ncbi:MAG: AAA family ATPase [Candidatus Promineifilaceae bacterium]|nr:AAA family ATPase [Candidatus Promineifilaceae bacterium]
MTALKLYFLGTPRMERSGQSVEVDTRKAVALAAYLAVGGEAQSRDALATFLWPELDDSRARAALRRTLSSLKSAVGDAPLYITRDQLGLELDQVWCDLFAFNGALEAVAAHDHDNSALCPACVSHLERAAALYRDDFLTGFSLRDSVQFDDWQMEQGELLRRSLARVLAMLVDSYQAKGEYGRAIEYAIRWLALDPLRESVHARLMQLYAWNEQRSAALRQYRECVRVLDEELGVAPLAETTALYEQIQQGELPAPTAPRQTEVLGIAGLPAAAPPQSALPLVGREAELMTMRRLYESVGPDGHFLSVTGEAGIGKSYLIQHFLDDLREAHILQARCYQGESTLAYAPFITALRQALQAEDVGARLAPVLPPWLTETTRLLPELERIRPELSAPPPFDWPGAAGRFLAGVSEVVEALLAGPEPGVLWLDDVQWADSASLELLSFLVRRQEGRPYLLVVSWREAELPHDHALHRLLAHSRRERHGERLVLSRLDEQAVARLLRSEGHDSPTLARRLYRETEGVPFLVSAYLRAGLEEAPAWELPPTARDLLLARLTHVGEMEQQLLQAAAVIGRGFDFPLLLAAGGRGEEETLLAFEGLLNRGLLAEADVEGVYDFRHHKLRELAYQETSLVRRRLLHRRVAQALVDARHAEPGELAGQIARHFQHGGDDAEAVLYYRRAGDHARSLFAHREALRQYEAALALGHPERAALREAAGDLHTRLGEYRAALLNYERAAAEDEAADLPRLAHKMGRVVYRLGQWERAERYFVQAEQGWQDEAEPDALARLYLDWSMVAHRAGSPEWAVALAERAQSLLATPRSEAQSHNLLGVLARSRDDLGAATEHFRHSAAIAGTHDLLGVHISALNNLALARAAAGDPQEAQALLERALAMCLRYGDRHWEAALRNNLADLLHAQGQADPAMAQLKQAVQIYAEIGQESGDWQPEVWKLSEW